MSSSAFDDWYNWAMDPVRASISRPRILEDAAPEDAAHLADLHESAFPVGWSAEDIEALVADDLVSTRVVRPLGWFGRGAIEGFIMVRRAVDEGEILTFAVARHCRGRGYGTRLLDDALVLLRQHGVQSVFLEVADNNMEAVKVYRRRGFEQVGERPAYALQTDGNKATALVMRREYR